MALEDEGNDVGVGDKRRSCWFRSRPSLLAKLAQKLEKILSAFGIILRVSKKILPANRRLQNKFFLDGRLFLS